jgi:hypothetical protein
MAVGQIPKVAQPPPKPKLKETKTLEAEKDDMDIVSENLKLIVLRAFALLFGGNFVRMCLQVLAHNIHVVFLGFE